MSAPRRHKVNESFFETVDTEAKAYVLGILYADGYNCVTGNYFRLALHAKDKDILFKIRDALNSEAPLLSGISPGFSKTPWKCLQICSKKMCQDLVRLGCFQAKTETIRIPAIPEHLYRHFVRGYFDGDGGLSTARRKNHTKYRVNIVSNPQFVNGLNDLFEDEFGRRFYVLRYTGHKKTEQIRIEGNIMVERFLKWLYNGATIYLNRKYDIYQKLLKRVPEWRRAIEVFDVKDGGSLGRFQTLKEASVRLGIPIKTIHNNINGKTLSKTYRFVDLTRGYKPWSKSLDTGPQTL